MLFTQFRARNSWDMQILYATNNLQTARRDGRLSFWSITTVESGVRLNSLIWAVQNLTVLLVERNLFKGLLLKYFWLWISRIHLHLIPTFEGRFFWDIHHLVCVAIIWASWLQKLPDHSMMGFIDLGIIPCSQWSPTSSAGLKIQIKVLSPQYNNSLLASVRHSSPSLPFFKVFLSWCVKPRNSLGQN